MSESIGNDDVTSAGGIDDVLGFGEQPVTELDSVKSGEEEHRPSGDSVVVAREHGTSDSMTLGAGEGSSKVKTSEKDCSSTAQESSIGSSEEVALESGEGEGPAGEKSVIREGCEAGGAFAEKRPDGMSKNQWKKQLRRQKWEAGRERRRYIHRHSFCFLFSKSTINHLCT